MFSNLINTSIVVLNNYVNKEQITYKDEKCPDNTIFYKKTLFINLPENLIIFFKRFNNENRIINIPIDFPLELNMSDYLLIKNNNPNIYSLYGHLSLP